MQLGSYSTSELATRYKWVDGKIIYQKTINFGALPNTTTKQVAHGISGLTKIIDMYGVTDSSMLPLPYFASPDTFGITLRADMTNIYITTGTNRSADTSYVTMLYIK